MEIDPIILVPGAGVAVLLMILYIRFVAGHREAILEEAGVTAFLQLQAPDHRLDRLFVSQNRKSALVFWQDEEVVGIVRSFGNKLVLQILPHSILASNSDGAVLIPRQGLTHPPLHFVTSEEMPVPFLPEGAK
ncbi:MAG: hypothetical protein NXI13_00070 [Proteobacteria bacterium]|nr:hypothetical protein [Pseudomonadota bacterium]